MKTLGLSLAILLAPLSVHAQTFAQDLAKQASTLSAKIRNTKLAAPFKLDFQNQLAAAMKTAGCRASSASAVFDCAQARPADVEKADGALSKISDAVDAAVLKDGAKPLDQLYGPQADALGKKLDASALDSTDKNALKAKIATFKQSLASRPGPAGQQLTPEKAQDGLDALSAEIDAAIELNQKGTTIHASYLKAYAALTAKIRGSKLTAPVAADFTAQAAKVNAGIVCVSSVKGMHADLRTGPSGPASSTCPIDPVKADAAEDALSKISDAVDDAIKADGSKTLDQIYAPKLDALTKKLAAGNVDAKDRAPIDAAIRNFTGQLKMPSGAQMKGMPGAKPNLDALDAEFQKLSDEVDAAVALAKTKGAFADNYNKKFSALTAKIEGSKLSGPIKADFRSKAAAAGSGVMCGASGAKLTLCPNAKDAARLEAAEDKIDAIAADVDAAIKADGSKTLGQLYQPKLDALSKSLDASAVDSADKRRLQQRVLDLQRRLDAASKGPGSMTPETAEDAYQKLSDDVAAAIELAKSKKTPAK